jgi:hypothetical protein
MSLYETWSLVGEVEVQLHSFLTSALIWKLPRYAVNRRNYWTRNKECSREGTVVMLGGGSPNWKADCYSSGYRGSSSWQHARGMNPITHLELVPRLETPGCTPPHPHTFHGEVLQQEDNFICTQLHLYTTSSTNPRSCSISINRNRRRLIHARTRKSVIVFRMKPWLCSNSLRLGSFDSLRWVHVYWDEGPTLILDKYEASAESHVGNAASYIRSIHSPGNLPTCNRFYPSVVSLFRVFFYLRFMAYLTSFNSSNCSALNYKMIGE